MKQWLHKKIGIMLIKLCSIWIAKIKPVKADTLKPKVVGHILYVDKNGQLIYQNKHKQLHIVGCDQDNKVCEPCFIGFRINEENE